MLIQKQIDKAASYVDSLKTYTKAAQIIDELLKAISDYSKITETQISELEMAVNEYNYHKQENKRLKRIIQIYGADPSLSDDELNFLERIKEPSQYFTDNTAREIIYQYIMIDAFMKKYKPDHETRPKNIEQIQTGFKLITERYADKN